LIVLPEPCTQSFEVPRTFQARPFAPVRESAAGLSPTPREDAMKVKLQLNLEELAVTTFETEEAPAAEQPKAIVRTCMDTACPPYHCCA
jgi:hypothetical protein